MKCPKCGDVEVHGCLYPDDTCHYAESRDEAIAFIKSYDLSKCEPMMSPQEMRDFIEELNNESKS